MNIILKSAIIITTGFFTNCTTAQLSIANTYQNKTNERLAQGALIYLTDYAQKRCGAFIHDSKWNQLASHSLRLHKQNQESLSELLRTLEKYISHESICRHIIKSVSVLAQCRAEYIEKNIALYSELALDMSPYLTTAEIIRQLGRSLTGFYSTGESFIEKKQALKYMEKKLGPDLLRANFKRGLGLLTLVDLEEILSLEKYLVQGTALLSAEEFEARLQNGLSIYGRKDLADQVESVIQALYQIGYSKAKIKEMFIENSFPFAHSKPHDILHFYHVYLRLLKAAHEHTKDKVAPDIQHSTTLEFLAQKLYLTSGLHFNDLNELTSILQRPELGLNALQVIDGFQKVLQDVSSHRIDWNQLRGNIGGLLRLKNETGENYFSPTTVFSILKSYILLLNQVEVSNILHSKNVSDSLRFSKIISIMAKAIAKDPDQLAKLKQYLNEQLGFLKQDFIHFLVEHHRVFVNFSEDDIIRKADQLLRILKPYLSVKKIKILFISSFEQWIQLENFENLHLIIDDLATLYTNENLATRPLPSFSEVLVTLILKGELISLSLDEFERRLRIAEELKYWGFTSAEALVHVFDKTPIPSPTLSLELIEIQKKRQLFELNPNHISRFSMRSLSTFLKRWGSEILLTPLEVLKTQLENAEMMNLSGANLERWIEAGFLDFYTWETKKFSEAFNSLEPFFSLSDIRYILLQSYSEKRELNFPRGLKSRLQSVFSQLDAEDLQWLKPHVHLIFSERGHQALEYYQNEESLKLNSHYAARYLYLSLIDINARLSKDFVLRAVAMAEPKIQSPCSGALDN